MKIFRFALLAFALSFTLAACKKAAPETHTTTGVIREVQAQGRVLVIEHQAFPGWMEGMTMPFEMKEPALAAGLKAGDKVEFTVSAYADSTPITAIKKIQP